METVVLNNTEYDVLVEEEARLIRLVFFMIPMMMMTAMILVTMRVPVIMITMMITMMMITQTGGGQATP